MLKERENVIVSAVEPTGANREKVWIQHSNNIVDKSLAIDNRYVWFNNNEEAISSNNNYWSTGRLQVKPNTTYYFNKNINYIVYYNNSGTAVRMETDKSSFITGSNEYYVQLSFAKSKVEYNSNIMISTIENASYEPYVEPKMYCLNDNNVYEEFIPEGEIVLWENPNPTSSFANQTITLNDISNYKYLEIYWKNRKDVSEWTYTKIQIGTASYGFCISPAGTSFRVFSRQINNENTNNLIFGNCNFAESLSSSITTNNDYMIPVKVIGYK